MNYYKTLFNCQVRNNQEQKKDDVKERNRLRKQQQRSNETEEIKAKRRKLVVATKKKRKAAETAGERRIRLESDAIRKKSRRSNETVFERSVRLKKIAENMKRKRRNETYKRKPCSKLKECEWPKSITPDVKKQCLKNFVNLMSKNAILQTICCICNRMDFNKLFIEKRFNEINGIEQLILPEDLLALIKGNFKECNSNFLQFGYIKSGNCSYFH